MIFFLYGPDTFRSKEKLNAIVKRFVDSVENADNSLLKIDGQKTNLQEINQSIKGESLFSEKKMLIIKNLLENKDKEFLENFLDYLKKEKISDSPHAIVFFEDDIDEKKLLAVAKKLFKYLSKEKFAQEFKLMTPYQAKSWIKEYVDKYHKEITEDAKKELIKNLGTNLWALKNELHKLCHLTKDVNISLKLVKENINLEIQENIFALTDSLGKKDYKTAIKLLSEQLQTEFSPEYILAMIRRQFQQIIQAKIAQDKGKNANDIASEFGLH
ncbi:DNA polymerase III subunit delta, partial [Patescibacteria group bacterium]|nr:DNA polymerase III subunit delta [Patescibacteria group bacterium]